MRIACSFLAVVLVVAALSGQKSDRVYVAAVDHPAIQYSSRPVHDAVSSLSGPLAFDEDSGYLKSLLAALEISVESQITVFTQTGIQGRRTGPANPRALYFNDTTVVGWVRGGPFLEMVSQDPEQGIIFYTLDQEKVEKPQPERRVEPCLTCHESYNSLGVPGMLARSLFPSPMGEALYPLGSFLTDHRSPLEQRWGGWYVTGKVGANRHMGNAFVTDQDKPEAMVNEKTLQADSLAGKFDTRGFPSAYSDVVALMVFDHQAHMSNLITRIAWETRVAIQEKRKVEAAQEAKEFVDYLLFVDEAALKSPIEGVSGFAKKFASLGPFDGKGRSFRQFDLERRMMRYPCSYMIYTEAFDAIPAPAKDAIYQRMWQILSGGDKDPKYSRLSPADRRAVIEILRDTKKDLPAYFQ